MLHFGSGAPACVTNPVVDFFGHQDLRTKPT